MKRILFLMISSVLLFAQCEHPFEQDLIGAFPFAELMDSDPDTFGSDASQYEMRVSTNMVITTRINYIQGGGSNDWIDIETTEEKGGIVRLTLKVGKNIRRQQRKAEVTIMADGSTKVDVITVNQKAYSVSDKENIHKGDLILKTQDEVNNCIYTKVEGNLIIGGTYTDIKNLSPLDVIASITGGVKIIGCPELKNMGGLGGLNVASVEFENVNPVLVGTWRGPVKEVVIKEVTTVGNVSLSSFTSAEKLTLTSNACGFEGFDGLKNLKVADMAGNALVDTEDMEYMTSLESLDLSRNPLLNVNSLAQMTWLKKIDLSNTGLAPTQINYLKEMLGSETEIVSKNLAKDASLSLNVVSVQYFKAQVEALYSSINISSAPNSYGYILTKNEEFSMEAPLAIRTSPNPLTFEIKNLDANTDYNLWLYAIDKNGAYHLSTKYVFSTPEIVFDYEGDLALETQDDVDNCLIVTVSGNLIIGKENSDITDISRLSITAVGGGVTIKGCHALNDFGPVSDYNLKYLELDDVSPSLPYQWDGNVSDLRIRNISTGKVNLSAFTDVVNITLQENKCGFSGLEKLKKVTDAVFSHNQFTTTDDIDGMSMLRNLDLSNNPLVNVNSLTDMTSIQKIDLSETPLSETQIRYLKNMMPEIVTLVSDNLTGTATLSVQDTSVRYRSAKMVVDHEGFSSYIESCGYVVSETSKFPGDMWLNSYFYDSIPSTFDINDLDDGTEYYVWFYVLDNLGSIHLSEPDSFKTKEIVENYVGDLVLKTQEDVDDCVHTSVTGSLTIGCPGSDIDDLSNLSIKSVTGDLTITGCSSLSNFGGLQTLKVDNIILDNTKVSIIESWSGTANTLTIRNCTNTSTYSLSDFDEITSLTLADNKCSFSYLDRLVNLIYADLPRNKFDDTEGMEKWTKLKTLNLSGNPLANVNELAQLGNLTSLDVSNTPLSPAQVRYVKESLPSTAEVRSSGITGTGTLSVSNTKVNYFSASFSATVSGINSYDGGYFISSSSTFPGEGGRVQKVDSWGQALTAFEASGLDDGATYTLWYYVVDGYDSIYLSDPITFTTMELKHYALTVNPSWPSFTNSASVKADFAAIGGRMLVYKEDVLGEKDAVLTKSDSKYSGEMTEGKSAIGFFAVQGTPTGNTYDGYTMAVTSKDMTSPRWTLSLTSENGSGSDIAVSTLKNDFQADASFDVQFVRPVAKINITADFTGSINNLDNVKDITISLNSHYTKCHFADISSVEYDNLYNSTKTLKFYAPITGMPDDKKITVAKDRFILPHSTDYTPSASVTITFKNGTTKTASLTYSTKIEANKVYDLTFVTAITDVQGSFTVDVVEVVHDEIEF